LVQQGISLSPAHSPSTTTSSSGGGASGQNCSSSQQQLLSRTFHPQPQQQQQQFGQQKVSLAGIFFLGIFSRLGELHNIIFHISFGPQKILPKKPQFNQIHQHVRTLIN
jgi:hypothetical protein